MNKLIGELEVELGGKKHTLKPTFEALVMMEDLAGKSLSDLVGVFLRSKAGIKDVAAVIYAGMYGKNDNRPGELKIEEIGNLVMHGGVVNFMGPCGMIVGCAYSGRTIDEALKAREAMKVGGKKEEEPSKNVVPPEAAEPSSN